MTIGIRRADNSDASWLSDCTRAAYAVYIPVLGREPVPMTIDYKNAIDEYEVWIAESSKERAGLLMLENHTNHMVIYSVAVLPAYERHGVGRELLNQAEEVTKLHGHRLIRLYTNELWERNIAIYRKLGYVDSHVEKYKGSNVIHLMKNLQS